MFLKMRLSWIIVAALIAVSQLHADTVTLVSGEKVTGSIKDETATEIVIDVPVSASITDERVIQKKDIAKVEKEQPDEIAYRQLIAVQPNPESSLNAQTYEQILTSLNAFQTQFPNSTYLPEIKKLAGVFQEEKSRVDKGEVKYQGRWLTREEAATRQIQIVGEQYYAAMQQQAAAGDLIGAMQTFDVIDKSYGTTRVYPPAVTLAEEVLAQFQQNLTVRMEAVKADQAQLKNTIAFAAEPEKSNIIAAAKAEQDRDTAVLAEAVRNGAKWVPLIPRSQVSIDTLQKTVASEAGRLAAIAVGPMNASVEKTDAARAAIQAGDLKTAHALLADATTLWAKNEAAQYWENELKAKAATPTPTPIANASPKALARTSPTPKKIVVAAATPEAEPEKPFYMTIQGSIGIAAAVLVIGGIIASISQKKARKAAAAE
jgi:hypothetical protein